MIIWSSEVYKRAGSVERQFMEIEFENAIRRFVGSNYVFTVGTQPGYAGYRSFGEKPLAFSEIYRSEGEFTLVRNTSGLHAVHKRDDFFLGKTLGECIRFYNGEGKTLDGFMRSYEW